MQRKKEIITSGQAYLGIELGSTRIKAVLVDRKGTVLESGGFGWENHLVNGIWTYSLEEVWNGIRMCYKDLTDHIEKNCGCRLTKLAGMGVSAMMHGYMAFDREGNQLVPFRTWRNNITGEAAEKLTELFAYNIPQRWSIAHLYQAVLNGEDHVKDIAYLTTLAGYVHWKLTGEKVLGVGEASGMFPIDTEKKAFNEHMIRQFNLLIKDKNYPWELEEILPEVLSAGRQAGVMSAEGAALLDPSGTLQAGCRMCPPEGDAGTGMVATNSVAKKTGNVSAGTSAFAMVVLEKELSKVYPQLDMVTTPTGALVAMAHSNNCTSDINAWVSLLAENLKLFGVEPEPEELYGKLFEKALEGDPDCGGLLSYCFYSGEHGVGLNEGCPMFLHPANAKFNLANFMKVHLYTCFGAMKMGMDLLIREEGVQVEKILGHGGIFKTAGVAQSILAAAIGVPVEVMSTAGEGGAWGIALLAAYLDQSSFCSLEDYLNEVVFGEADVVSISPDAVMAQGYEEFLKFYKQGLAIEQAAIPVIREKGKG